VYKLVGFFFPFSFIHFNSNLNNSKGNKRKESKINTYP